MIQENINGGHLYLENKREPRIIGSYVTLIQMLYNELNGEVRRYRCLRKYCLLSTRVSLRIE